MPTAIMALIRLVPKIAITTSASRMPGNAKVMSAARMITESVKPPK